MSRYKLIERDYFVMDCVHITLMIEKKNHSFFNNISSPHLKLIALHFRAFKLVSQTIIKYSNRDAFCLVYERFKTCMKYNLLVHDIAEIYK